MPARKQAGKGARYACIDHATVFGWAVHYFEENSIEGTLYNKDDTEYKPKPVVRNTAAAVNIPVPVPKLKAQMSLFDLMDDTTGEASEAEQARIDEQETEQEAIDEPEDEEDTGWTEDEIRAELEALGQASETEPKSEGPATAKPWYTFNGFGQSPQEFRQIHKTGYADSDGVIHDIPKEITCNRSNQQPVSKNRQPTSPNQQPIASNQQLITIPSVLSKLFGDALIMR